MSKAFAGERSFPRWFVAVVATVAAAAFLAHDRTLGFDGLYGLFGNGVDTDVYRRGGQTVLDSESLYSFALFDNLPFTYPPFAALVFVPLALLSVTATALLVGVGNLALLYTAVYLSWRRLGYAPAANTRVVSVALAGAFTWLEPVRMSMWLGQINLLLLVLVLWDLGRPADSRLRGLGVGIAAGLKLTPGFFLFYLLTTRQWRDARTAVYTGIATVVLGFVVLYSDAWRYWTSAVFQPDRIGLLFSPANQSVNGILARLLHTDSVPALAWIVCAGAAAAAGLWAAGRAHRCGRELLALSICGLTAPMASPFSWGHHWVWLVPLVVITLDVALRSGSTFASRLLWALPLGVTLPTLAWFHVYPDGVTAIGTFMYPLTDPVAELILQNAYPILFSLTVGATLIVCRPVAAATSAELAAGDGPDADAEPAHPLTRPRNVRRIFDRDVA